MDHVTTKQIKFEDLTEIPSVVYKYRTWSDVNHKTILTNQIVFMAKPSSFEDPIDCKLQKNYSLLTEAEIYDKYFHMAFEKHPDWSISECLNYAAIWHDNTPMRDKGYINTIQKKEFDEFDARFGVLSLTANPRNKSMWEKYSENHAGFCVGFNAKKMFAYLGGGAEVQYTETLPTIYPSDNFDTEHFKQVFFKEKKWAFEEEYRTHKFYQNPASNLERCIKLPRDVYAEIIFGAKMSSVEKLEIITICKRTNLNPKYYVEILNEKTGEITLCENSFS